MSSRKPNSRGGDNSRRTSSGQRNREPKLADGARGNKNASGGDSALRLEEEELEQAEKNEAVSGVITVLIERLNEYIDFASIRPKIAPFAVCRAMVQAMEVLSLALVPRTSVPCDVAHDGCVADNWRPDAEPVPAPIDTWARMAVPMKRRTPPQKEEPLVRLKASPSRSLSPSRRDSLHSLAPATSTNSPPLPLNSNLNRNFKTVRISGKTGGTQGTPPGSAVAPLPAPERIPSPPTPSRLGPISKAVLTTGAPVGTPPLPGTPLRSGNAAVALSPSRRQLSQEEVEREQRLREEIQARREKEALRRAQEEQERLDAQRLQELQKSLRGQDYSYGHRGEVVVLTPVEPEKLPPTTVGVRVTISDGLGSPEDLERGGGKEGGGGAEVAGPRVIAWEGS